MIKRRKSTARKEEKYSFSQGKKEEKTAFCCNKRWISTASAGENLPGEYEKKKNLLEKEN